MNPTPSRSEKTRVVLLHACGWLIFFVMPLLLSPPGEIESALENPANLFSLAIRNTILIGLFYLNYFYLTPRVLQVKGVMPFLWTIIPLVLLVTFISWEIHHILAEPVHPPFEDGPGPFGRGPGRGPGPPFGPRPMMMASSLFASLLITVIITSISTSLVLWEKVAKSRMEEQERALQRVASELAVLKLQISPHFLFNTLNNIRWLVRSGSDKAEEAVMKLSKLLRYVLYQTHAPVVTLESEIDNLRDYIDLQLLRLPDTSAFRLQVNGDPGHAQIIPLVLLPLAENLFKYGDFSAGYVNRLEISITADRIHVVTVNKVRPQNEPDTREDSGIGLHNISRRLALNYPDAHEFSYGEKEGVFEVNLGIIRT